MYRFGNACLSRSLADCPWCALDNQGVIYFIDLAKRSLPPAGILCWRKSGRWCGVSSTTSIATAITRSFSTDCRPLPLGLLRREYIILIEIACQRYRCCFAAFRQNRVILFCSCAVGYLDYWQPDKQSVQSKIQQRREAFNRAKMDYDHLVARSNSWAGWKVL